MSRSRPWDGRDGGGERASAAAEAAAETDAPAESEAAAAEAAADGDTEGPVETTGENPTVSCLATVPVDTFPNAVVDALSSCPIVARSSESLAAVPCPRSPCSAGWLPRQGS